MLASWVQQGTSTTGTGTITLDGTPSAGFQAFSNAFTTGDVVQYTIEDGNNREVGIGTLTTGASWTLSRDTILEKLDSGTYTKLPATGLTLSGSAVVGVAATSSNLINNTPVFTANPLVNNRVVSAEYSGVTLNSAMTADRLEFYPIYLSAPIKFNAIEVFVSTADAASTDCRVGIYLPDDTGAPDRLLASGTFDATTTGAKQASLGATYYLPPGNYWQAVKCDSSSISMRRDEDIRAHGHIWCGVDNALSRCYPHKSSVTGALPDPAGALTGWMTVSQPVVFVFIQV